MLPKNNSDIGILLFKTEKYLPAVKEQSEFEKDPIGILNEIRFRKSKNIIQKKLSTYIGQLIKVKKIFLLWVIKRKSYIP